MPLKRRLIARLDIRSPNLIKTIQCEGVRVVGDPHEYACRYDAAGIDEILFLDVVASLYGRNSLAELVSKTTADVFVPVTVGGGIRSCEDVRALLNAGADKVAVNTAAIKRPQLISEIAQRFGSQCFVLQVDAKRSGDGWQAFTDGGREPTGKDAIGWARQAVERGAGEILVTSIDREGTRKGCDLELIQAISKAVSVPVVAAGGVGGAGDVVAAFHAGADGVAMAGLLHYGERPLDGIRQAMVDADIPVRLAA